MKVLTANRLSDGIAVWFSSHGWTTDIAKATSVSDAEGEARLYANNEVIDVNVVDAELANGNLAAVKLRERIRAAGPTINYAPRG